MTTNHPITDLFTRGTTIKLADGRYAWVMKPTAFHRGEAQRDARRAVILSRSALKADIQEMSALHSQLEMSDPADVAHALAEEKRAQYLSEADDDLRAEKDWAERFEVIDRVQISTDEDAEPDEQEMLILEEYELELTKRSVDLHNAYVRELLDLSQDELFEVVEEAFLQRHSLTAYLDARTRTEVYYALRKCVSADGEDHSQCDHRKALPNKGAVEDLADEVNRLVQAALRDLEISDKTAGN